MSTLSAGESSIAINAAAMGDNTALGLILRDLVAVDDALQEQVFGSMIVSEQTAVTATADGTGTGTIPDTARWVNVTSANANNIVILPAPTPGRIVALKVSANGCEVRSSVPASVAINGGTGASAESAIPAGAFCVFICTTATTWQAFQIAADGTTAGVQAAS